MKIITKNMDLILAHELKLIIFLNSILLMNQFHRGYNFHFTVLFIAFLIIFFIVSSNVILSKSLKIFLTLLLIFLGGHEINVYWSNRIIIHGDLRCENSFLKKVFTYENNDYYSTCEFYDIKLEHHGEIYPFYEFVNIYRDQRKFLIEEFKLEQMDSSKQIRVVLSDNPDEIRYIKTDFDTRYYYYGIDEIVLKQQNREYEMSDGDYPLSVEFFLEMKRVEDDYNAFYQGKYYNMISCIKNYHSHVQAYLIPLSKDVKSIDSFCNSIEEDHNNYEE